MAEPFPKLIVLTGSEEGQDFALPRSGTVLIGRSDENQFSLEDSSVSRQHAVISAREGKYFIKDSDSRNGTVLEDKKLSPGEEVALAHLDEFRLGIYEIRFAEKSFTDAEVRSKKQQAKSSRPVPKEPPPLEKSIDKTSAAAPTPPAQKDEASKPAAAPAPDDAAERDAKSSAENLQAESLIDNLLEERDHVEDKLPPNQSGLKKLLMASLVLVAIAGLGYAGYKNRVQIRKACNKYYRNFFGSGESAPADGPAPSTPALKPLTPPGTASPSTAQTGPIDPTATAGDPRHASIPSDNDAPLAPIPESLAVLPAATAEAPPPNSSFSVFLDVTTEPFPATIYFGEERLGTAPLKSSVQVEADKIYELYADYELRDLNDIYRKKVRFKAMPNSDVVELAIKAEIGVLKILRLPPRAEFYLEGYYDYDQLKANPVKLTDIIYGQPVFLPYGKYLVELREQVSVSGSENLITQIRYQREFHVNEDEPLVEMNVTDKDLKYFPAVVKSNPSNAEVHYNGEKMGVTPFKGNLPVGTGQLKLVKDGFFDKTVDVDMRMNSVYEITVELETSKVGEFLNKAKEQVRNGQNAEALNTLVEALKYGGSTKEKAEVYYMLGEGYLQLSQHALAEPYYQKAKAHPDFALKGALGLAKIYNAQKRNDLALTTVIEVLANIDANTPPSVRGEASTVFKKISPIKSVIYVYTDPQGADVYLNDKKLSQQTPLILSDLGLGNYRIEIEHPGYKTYKTKQTLKLGEFVMVKARLEKESF